MRICDTPEFLRSIVRYCQTLVYDVHSKQIWLYLCWIEHTSMLFVTVKIRSVSGSHFVASKGRDVPLAQAVGGD